MSTADAHLTIRGIGIDVIRKDIKNLHIGVYPPAGRVRVAAPDRLSDDQVRLAIIQRLPWIKKQQLRLRTADRQSQREMVTGESHYVWGRRLRLKVIERPSRAHIEVDGDRLLMYVPPGTSDERRRLLLDHWHREQLRAVIPGLLARWEPLLQVSVSDWNIRRMRTKWGTCNRETRRIWLNVELAKKHPHCLEFILVHEMTHLLERNHGARFLGLMDQFMQSWRVRSEQLNSAPLDAREWAR